jgi:hypothetical protein
MTALCSGIASYLHDVWILKLNMNGAVFGWDVRTRGRWEGGATWLSRTRERYSTSQGYCTASTSKKRNGSWSSMPKHVSVFTEIVSPSAPSLVIASFVVKHTDTPSPTVACWTGGCRVRCRTCSLGFEAGIDGLNIFIQDLDPERLGRLSPQLADNRFSPSTLPPWDSTHLDFFLFQVGCPLAG